MAPSESASEASSQRTHATLVLWNVLLTTLHAPGAVPVLHSVLSAVGWELGGTNGESAPA